MMGRGRTSLPSEQVDPRKDLVTGKISKVNDDVITLELTDPKDIEKWGKELKIWTKESTTIVLDGAKAKFEEAVKVGRVATVEHVRGATPYLSVKADPEKIVEGREEQLPQRGQQEQSRTMPTTSGPTER